MKVVNCPCGERIEGETDDVVVERVNQHLSTAHPDMAGKYSDEQILSMAPENVEDLVGRQRQRQIEPP